MQDYSKPMVGFVALKFSILIAQRLFNGKSVSSNLAFMPVANKVGQRVEKFILIFLMTPVLGTATRGHKYKYRVKYSRTNIYKEPFFPSGISLWNQLPEKIKPLYGGLQGRDLSRQTALDSKMFLSC